MTSASLSVLDPALIDGFRSKLAEDFAQRIFDIIPEVSECIEFEAEACTNGTGKKRFQRASQLLHSRRRDLQSQTDAVVRRIFDERLFRLIDGVERSGRVSLDSMSLLADDRLDEEIAVSHCSRRLKEQGEFELWALTTRIVLMTGIERPADSQNPVSPQTFAQALMEAIGSLETEAGARLVVFKTFGPALLDIVPAVYMAANAALSARGIDVESAEYYGRPVLTPVRQSAALPTQDEIALGAAKVNMALTSALTQILAKSTASLPIHVEHTGPGWHSELKEIETRSSDQPPGENARSRTLHGARQALQDRLTRDEQVISDIITVMFDRLLADARMPTQLREIVSRLQLPVLELALRDRSLLTQVHHPARKLLDLIAEFGLTLGLNDGNGDGDHSTVRSVASIVDGLIQIRNDVPDAFTLAFDRLDGLFYHHEEAALLTDSDLRKLERDEAVQFATSQAEREIALRLQNLTLPTAISDFILTVWREVLVQDYLRGGSRGDQWKLGMATLDDVLKSLRASTSEPDRQRLANALPASINFQLGSAIKIGNLQAFTANFFAGMRRAHELAIAGRWAEIGGERFVPSPAALAASSSAGSPSATLASLGLACGDWIETRDSAGTRRWRLNWITSILGTCVFKHYESGATCNMSCEELRERLSSGGVQRVRGLGLADELLNSAFETVSRKVRRDAATQSSTALAPAKGGMAHMAVTDRVMPSLAASLNENV